MLERLVIVGALLGCIGGAWSQVPGNGSAQNKRPQGGQNQAQTVHPSPPALNAEVKDGEKQDSASRPSGYPWRELYAPANIPNWVLALVGALAAFAAIKTLRAINAQVIEMQSTGKQTDKLIQENIAQSASLERSVAETARFATAVENVAKSLESTAEASTETLQGLRKQMRAYLTVIIGGGIPQNPERTLRFDARPTVLNAGPTPARNVRTRIKSAILPISLPEDFDQSIATDKEESGNFIGAHQTAQMMAVVDDYVPDDQVEDIKSGKGPSMYTWGVVTYEDVFGKSHTTKFCQRLTWLPDGKVFGYYIPGRNDAD
jgi:hypothetical protein